jgi:phosphoserine phosphatase RsbU/P
MEEQLKILLIEDNVSDAGLLERELKKANMNYSLRVVDNKDLFVKELYSFKPEVVLSDHSLPSFNSLEALKIARGLRPDIPFILVTGAVSEEFAVECMKAGADDYILKNSLIRLPSSILSVFSKKSIKREKEIIESLHNGLQVAYKEIKEKNNNITDSINYAKLIQEAMLPEKGVLAKIFSQSFILNKPKDIVSGDFYWFTEYDNKLLIAVADCTGHGVPGALLSMIGYNLLSEIVNIKGITQPAEILKILNEGVRRILKQDSKENQTRDGMDVALCSIDRKNQKLIFAGANRPLFFFRNDELEFTKGNSYGIGGIQSELVREYTNHEFSFSIGDVIYMYTDGFVDQFGGKDNKKIMRGNFVNLLTSIQYYDLPEQEEILNRWLNEWKGDLEQTDDILLIGIKL